MTHAEIEAMLAAATQGEWEWEAPSQQVWASTDEQDILVADLSYDDPRFTNADQIAANGKLIASASTVIRQLLEEQAALAAERDQLKDQIAGNNG